MFVNYNSRPHHYFDDDFDFGFALNPKELMEEVYPRRYSQSPQYYQPQKKHQYHQRPLKRKQIQKDEEDCFKVHFDVSEFAPEELSVKTVDNVVVIEGKQEDKTDGDCVVSRQFVRKYPIPEGYDADTVRSSISTDGKRLTIKGLRLKESTNSAERVVQIHQH